jgi:hypothetical protein
MHLSDRLDRHCFLPILKRAIGSAWHSATLIQALPHYMAHCGYREGREFSSVAGLLHRGRSPLAFSFTRLSYTETHSSPFNWHARPLSNRIQSMNAVQVRITGSAQRAEKRFCITLSQIYILAIVGFFALEAN